MRERESRLSRIEGSLQRGVWVGITSAGGMLTMLTGFHYERVMPWSPANWPTIAAVATAGLLVGFITRWQSERQRQP